MLVCGELGQLVSQDDPSLHPFFRDAGQPDDTAAGAVPLHGQRQRCQADRQAENNETRLCGLQLPAAPARPAFTCSSQLQTLLLAQTRFVVGVHETVNVAAAAPADGHRLPHHHPSDGNRVDLTHTGNQVFNAIPGPQVCSDSVPTKGWTACDASYLPSFPAVPPCHQNPSS